MKDVLQLTTAIVMASSAKKKNKTPTFRRWSFSDNFTIETDDEAHSSLRNRRSVANIFSSSLSLVGWKRCLEFLTR